jgi:WD40 repeat protein
MKICTLFSVFIFLSFWGFAQQQGLETVLQKGHSKLLSSYCFSPGGQYVVTGAQDNTLIIWDFKSGKIIRQIARHTEAIRTVVFSPDGKFILSASADNTARIFEVISGKQTAVIKLPKNELHQAYFNSNGKYVYLLDGRDGCWLYTTSGKKVFRVDKNYSAFYQQHLIDPSGTKILSAPDYKGVVVLGIEKQDTLLKLPFDKPNEMAFSADGKRIAISSAKLFSKVFDATNGKLLFELIPPGDKQCDGCNMHQVFSNDGKWLLTKSNYTNAVLWNMNTGKPELQFCPDEERPSYMRFSANDQWVLIAFDENWQVFETKSGKRKLHIKSDRLDYMEGSFSPDNKFLLVPGSRNEIEVWELQSGKKVRSLEGYLNKKRDDGMAFDETYWRDRSILRAISSRRGMALHPDGKKMVIGNVDSSALVVDLFTGKVIKTLHGHHQSVYLFAFSADGKTLATGGADRQIRLWNTENWTLIRVLKGHQQILFDIQFSPEGDQLISGAWDGQCLIWNLQDEEVVGMDLGNKSPYTVRFSPNGLYFFLSDLNKETQMLERDSRQQFRTLTGHTDVVSSMSFSREGQTIVTGSWDGMVKVWDMKTGMLLQKMTAHTGQVNAVTIDHKKNTIISGAADNLILVWDPVNNKMVMELKGHAAPITSLIASYDGTRLYSLSEDGMFKVWDLLSGKEIYSRTQISREEWLVTTPSGMFDGSSKAQGLVNYVNGMEVAPVGSLFSKYFSPDLIQRISKGEFSGAVNSQMQKDIAGSPVIDFLVEDGAQRSLLSTTDSVLRWNKKQFPVSVQINSQGLSLQEIRIYNNGKLVLNEPFKNEVVFRGGDKDVRHYAIDLHAGTNVISAVVVNENSTESSPAEVAVQYDEQGAKTDLIMITIGINSYKNPQYKLNYAVNDAKAFSQVIRKGADSLFASVQEFNLFDDQATRGGVLAVVEQVKAKAGPEDVLLFYYAGHGVMSAEKDPSKNEFFLVTHELTNLYAEPQVLREKAIAAAELMKFSMQIPALKQLFILDACHSGGALNALATRGDGREKAIAQLARSTGTFFLTAAQDAQFANEVGNLKHGLFTYALLEILEGKVQTDGDNKITVNEMKAYVEERVPELSQQFRGTPQYPTGYSFGQDFPILILK